MQRDDCILTQYDVRHKTRNCLTCLYLLSTLLLCVTHVFAADGSERPAHPNIGLGRFHVRILSLQNLLRPGSAANSLYDIRQNDLRVTASFGYGNVWNNERDVYLIDGEWAHGDVRIAYAISDTLEAGVMVPFSSRHGGFMDRTIESFHNSFGFENRGRDKAPRNDVRIERYQDGETTYSLTDSSIGINDIPIFLAWHVSRGNQTWPALILQPKITIPAGDQNQLEGLGKPSYGMAVILAKRMFQSDHYLFLEGDVSYSTADDLDGLTLHHYTASGTFGWEYRLSNRTSLLAQYNVSSGIAREYHEWSQDAHHLNIGFKRRIARSMLFEFSIQENLFRYKNSTDVGLHMAVTQLF